MNRRGFLKVLGAAAAVAISLRLSSAAELVTDGVMVYDGSFPVGWVVTDEEIEDNLYGEISKQYIEALARSMQETQEVVGLSVLNKAGPTIEYHPLRMETRFLS